MADIEDTTPQKIGELNVPNEAYSAKAIEQLTYAINSLVLATIADSEATREIVRARVSKYE